MKTNDAAELLRERLRQEAEADLPDFSPLLHERIMSGIRRAPARVEGAFEARGRLVWPLAAAAAIVAVGYAGWRFMGRAPEPAPRMVRLPSPADFSAPVDRLLSDAAAPASESFEQGKYAYLDQDARRLMMFVAEQLPGPPSPLFEDRRENLPVAPQNR